MNPHDANTYEMLQIEVAQLQDEMPTVEEPEEEERTRFYEHFRF